MFPNNRMWYSFYTGRTLCRCMLSSFVKTVIIISRLWSIRLLLILDKDSAASVCKWRENFRFPVLYYISYVLGLCSLVKNVVFLCLISRSGPCKIRLVNAPSVSVAVRGFKVAGILFLNMHVKPYIAWVERETPFTRYGEYVLLQLQWAWSAGELCQDRRERC